MFDFFQQSGKLYFDEATCNTFDPETQIDESNFVNFRAETGFLPGISDHQIRQNLHLFTSDGHFKRCAVLFFGAHPESFYEQAIIRCVAFRGTNKRFISDDKTYGGSLFHQYISAMEWLRGKLNVAYDIEGQGGGPRKEVWEIPETVFKEAIINALSHRDYYEKGAVTSIELFDDRVEMSNPGELLAAVGKDFGHKSVSRNPLIFGLFQRIHLVEKVGSGILRMEELMLGSNLPTPIYQKEGMFTFVFNRPDVTVEETVEETSEKILSLIDKNNSITISELAKMIGLTTRAIEKQIDNLKNQNKLKRIGSDKSGHWQILPKLI